VPDKLCLIAIKDQKVLEVWSEAPRVEYLCTYSFTGFSGKLGPKIREGDGQIPEGIYKISYLNPNSSYHLSLKISYPNLFDKNAAKLEKRAKLGGDIFIHGKSVTIGCIPIGDENIEKLFQLVHYCGKENTRVIISPNNLRTNEAPKAEIHWLKDKYNRLAKEMNKFH
jgi:murein L,D-transpeptidase YafK